MSLAAASGNVTLRFESLRANAVFPGRNSLYPHEVSKVLRISTRQVHRLIESGTLDVVRISANEARSHVRIAVSSYDQFIADGGTKVVTHNGKKAHGRNGERANGRHGDRRNGDR